ncbi:hypothetical protein IQ06DRAFT_115378 [Phaeosphaeriaceae sp. SRC1lsM3a]|nr:hypothetical protein IQ06DRAFT_115378 [Stagonospora sp. SRC1lsM3a]
MSWFLRGVQSAVFHYASCAPCTGWADGRKRRRAAKAARKLKDKLHLEDPDAYQHPPPTGTNPYWDEEIRLGPGPPPRRARRTNTTTHTGSTQRVNTAGTQHSAQSKPESSADGDHRLRLSDDTTDDETWNHKRYQREDEDLWGIDEPAIALQHVASGSSVGVTGYSAARPPTSRSDSYYSVRAPPVNDLHPPVVSNPSPDPADNRWMLQPPPKASVMAGRERASNRSRSGSGASSRVELSLQRQLSTKQVKHKLDRGETPEMPSMSRNSSYNNLVAGQRHERGRTVNARPPSASSSRRKKRHDTVVLTRSDTASTHASSGEPGDTIRATRSAPGTSDIRVIRVRQSRPALSTVVSSGSGVNDPEHTQSHSQGGTDENALLKRSSTFHHASPDSSTQTPYLRAPLSSSDVSSLNRLQDLVSPRDLLKSRFVAAPLVEAKIRLPSEDYHEERNLNPGQSWSGNRFSSTATDQQIRVPFDNKGLPARDPRFRWSVDF